MKISLYVEYPISIPLVKGSQSGASFHVVQEIKTKEDARYVIEVKFKMKKEIKEKTASKSLSRLAVIPSSVIAIERKPRHLEYIDAPTESYWERSLACDIIIYTKNHKFFINDASVDDYKNIVKAINNG